MEVVEGFAGIFCTSRVGWWLEEFGIQVLVRCRVLWMDLYGRCVILLTGCDISYGDLSLIWIYNLLIATLEGNEITKLGQEFYTSLVKSRCFKRSVLVCSLFPDPARSRSTILALT